MSDLIKQYTEELFSLIGSSPSILSVSKEIQNIRFKLDDLVDDKYNLHLTNTIKTIVQEEIVRTLVGSQSNRNIIFVATGVGKTKAAIDYICERFDVVGNMVVGRIPKILVVVPTTKLKTTGWKDEFFKFGKKDIYHNYVEMICYASLSKLKGTEWDLVIFDEGHNITTENGKFFEDNTVSECLFMTATKPENAIKQRLIEKLGFSIVYKLKIDQAVELGIVAPYDLVTIDIDALDNKRAYLKGGNKAKPFFQTEAKKYAYLSFKILMGESTKFDITTRARIIYNSIAKTAAAKYILEHLIPPEVKTLVFAGSIAQADLLCDRRYHTKNKTKNIDLELFKEDKINRLSCVNALNEGQNLGKIDCAFIVQINDAELRFIQRVGRLIRYRPGFRGKVVILRIKNTVDTDWCHNATRNVATRILSLTYDQIVSGLVTPKLIFDNLT